MFRLFVERPFDYEEFRRLVVQNTSCRRANFLWNKLPWLRRLSKVNGPWLSEVEEKRFAGIIDSMTPEERKKLFLIDIPRRRHRVALGAGVEQAEVLRMVEQFDVLSDFVKQHKAMGLVERMRLLFRMVRQEVSILCQTSSK